MTVVGQKRKSGDAIATSDLPLKADIKRTSREVRKVPTRDSCTAAKFVLFATSLPRLSIGCAITGLIATAVSNHAGRPADVWSNADSWVAKPSQSVQYRRD
jgi:hypothetical protein